MKSRQWKLSGTVWLLAILLLCAPVAGATNKSGLTDSAISLPHGPGSLEGMGESFKTEEYSGMAEIDHGIVIPPGPAGHVPALAFKYSSGNGNGVLGHGWQIPLPFVQRRTDQGIPLYVDRDNGLDDDLDGQVDEMDERDAFMDDSMKEELVSDGKGNYFCKIQGSFIRYRQKKDKDNHIYWEGVHPNGHRVEFGSTPDARILDKQTKRVFKWLVERETDTHGNSIIYRYTSFDDGQNRNNRYLAEIRYGAGATETWKNFHFILFAYEDREDWYEDCRSGFIVRTGKRLSSITIGTQGPDLPGHVKGDYNQDGKVDYLNRIYRLSYFSGAPWSVLQEIMIVGADGKSTLPPSRYEYMTFNPPEILSARDHIIGTVNPPLHVFDNPLADLVDLNGDGAPDILKTDYDGGPHVAYINEGAVEKQGNRAIQWSKPRQVSSEDGRAWAMNLQSDQVIARLSDMDGDGMADLVYHAEDETAYFRNLGTLGWWSRVPMTIQDFHPPAPFESPEIKSADMDFDKRMDIVQSVPVGSGVAFHIWLNLGNQIFSQRLTTEINGPFMLSDHHVHLADFNGDRVPDLIRLTPEGVLVAAGLGYGHFAESIMVPIPNLAVTQSQLERAEFIDISGDGFDDLVIERPVPGELWYWINPGNYSFQSRKKIVDLPAVYEHSVVRWADLNGNGTKDLIYANQQSNPKIQSIDIGVLVACVPGPNMLVQEENGMGAIISILYTTSTQSAIKDALIGNPWSYSLPFPANVVSSVKVSDSLGNNYVTNYNYHNGYYDASERQFRGFEQVDEIQIGDKTAPMLITRSSYYIGREQEALKGKCFRYVEEQEDGKWFQDIQTAWKVKTIGTTGNGKAVLFPHPVNETVHISECGKGTPVTIYSEFDYDAYGNEILHAQYGVVKNGDRSALNDERITKTTYMYNPEKWIVHLPAKREISDEQGNVLSRVAYFYDDETFSGNNPESVIKGVLTLQREWIDPKAPSAFIEAVRLTYDAHGNHILSLDPLASAPGGKVDMGRGHIHEIEYDSAFATHPTSLTVHPGDGKRPLVRSLDYELGFGVVTTSTDFNGNATIYNHDPFARIVSIVRPGDTPKYPTTQYAYVLGIKSGNTVVNYIETWRLDKHPNPRVVCEKRDYYHISRLYIDGLQRHLMLKEEAENDPGTNAPRVAVHDAAAFNARLKQAFTLQPFYAISEHTNLESLLAFENIRNPRWRGTFHENGTLVTLSLQDAHKTIHTYDATLRELQTIHPDDATSRTEYEPLVTISYDENDSDPASPHYNTPLIHRLDGLNRIIKIDQVVRLNDDGTATKDLKTWSTSYTYDANNHMVCITDSQNNVTDKSYDGLGRLLSTHDPDRGVMLYTYDDAGNLIAFKDAKEWKTYYTYDGVNRMLTEEYPDDVSTFNVHQRPHIVRYHYDNPADETHVCLGDSWAPANTMGLLSYVEDLSGQEHYSYDKRGRENSTVKCIRNPDNGSWKSFKTDKIYDSMDRIESVCYPSGYTVIYQYNSRALLESIKDQNLPNPQDYISGTDYTPSGHLQKTTYGNHGVTEHEYDSRLRMNSLKTSVPSSEILNYKYHFDPGSQILKIEDNRPEAEISSGNPRRNTQIFSYEDLYRIVNVQYSFAAPNEELRNNGHITYHYDRIGNMLSKVSGMDHIVRGKSATNLGKMSYGGSGGTWNRRGRNVGDQPGPHALSSAEGAGVKRKYTYDVNGNMQDDDGLTNVWDAKDRIVSLKNSAMNISAVYTYDHSNRRIWKKVIYPSEDDDEEGASATFTFYVNRYYELRKNNRPVHTVWAGDTRVAQIELKDDESLVRFIHQDYLGSTNAITDKNGVLQFETTYYPFGYPRQSYASKGKNAEQTRLTLYLFTQKEIDEESGLTYFGARYEDAVTGRWLSWDPSLASQPGEYFHSVENLNPYQYVDNGPIIHIDPDGHGRVKYTPGWTKRDFRKKPVPTMRTGFAKWWKGIPHKTFKSRWKTEPQFKRTIKRRLRHGGGKHEFIMVAYGYKAHRWGIPIKVYLRDLRVPTKDLVIIERSTGQIGGHGRKFSGAFHHDLGKIIKGSRKFRDFRKGVRLMARKTGGSRFQIKLKGHSRPLPTGFYRKILRF